ncbi:hypothetical protein MA16_Dca003149 [Dendrobium catenatum]|uniref:Transmembrane protein 53 n=1 Tax=Dendrobium catenatum TaxID=906689 RepID=A0A2I0XBX6_9ASPA|nr:hypothetical protein MA16_Dca003149 [Dendrobium catenatum]
MMKLPCISLGWSSGDLGNVPRSTVFLSESRHQAKGAVLSILLSAGVHLCCCQLIRWFGSIYIGIEVEERRFYWLRKEEGGRRAGGIVVLFAWLSSQESHLKPYVDLYWSLGWDCLVCHVDFLTQFFPEKATELAIGIVGELIKEVKIRPMPIVLAAFSAGSKGYFFKVLQLVEGKCAGQHNQDDFLLLRDCISGQIYDSCPVDFTNDLGLQFVLHSSVLKMSYPPRVVSCMAKAFASGLDALFLNSFEAQRAEYWQTLYSSVSMGPFIILCSEDDKLAPYQTLYSFAQCLQELGADVNLIKWSSSPHVDIHYISTEKLLFFKQVLDQ